MYSAPQLLSEGSAILKGVGSAVKGGRNLYRVPHHHARHYHQFCDANFGNSSSSFLPDIIGYFQKRRQEEQIRNQLIGTVIPSIKSKLRSELPKDFEDQVNGLINENAVALDSQIKAKQSEIAEAEQAKKDALQDIGQTIADLTSIRENIRLLATPVLFAQQGERTMNQNGIVIFRKELERVMGRYHDFLGDEAQRLCREYSIPTGKNLQADLAAIADEGRLLKIGIVGRVKSGKSSLLNALLFDGQSILPRRPPR